MAFFQWRRVAYRAEGAPVRGHVWVLPDDPVRHVLRLLQAHHGVTLSLAEGDADELAWQLPDGPLKLVVGDAPPADGAAEILAHARAFDVLPESSPALEVQHLRAQAALAAPLDGDAIAAAFERLAATAEGAAATRGCTAVIGAPRPPDMVCYAVPRAKADAAELTREYPHDKLRAGVHVLGIEREVADGCTVRAQVGIGEAEVTVAMAVTQGVLSPEGGRAAADRLVAEILRAAGVRAGAVAVSRLTATTAVPGQDTRDAVALARQFPGAFETVDGTARGVYAADPAARATSTVSVFRSGKSGITASVRAMPSIEAAVCAATRVLQAHESVRRTVAVRSTQDVLAYRLGKDVPRPKTVSGAAAPPPVEQDPDRPTTPDAEVEPFLAEAKAEAAADDADLALFAGGATRYAKRKGRLAAGEVGEVPVATIFRRTLYVVAGDASSVLARAADRDLGRLLRGSPARVLWSLASEAWRTHFVAAGAHAVLERGTRPTPEAIVAAAAERVAAAVTSDLVPDTACVLGDVLGLNVYALDAAGVLTSPEHHWTERRTALLYFPETGPAHVISTSIRAPVSEVVLAPRHPFVQSVLSLSATPTRTASATAGKGAVSVDLAGRLVPGLAPAAEVLPLLPVAAPVRLDAGPTDVPPEVPRFPPSLLGLSGSPAVASVPWTRDDCFLPQASPYAIFPWFASGRAAERVRGRFARTHVRAESSTETPYDLVQAAARFVRKSDILLAPRIRARGVPGALAVRDEIPFLRALAGPAGSWPGDLATLPGEALQELADDLVFTASRARRKVRRGALVSRNAAALAAVEEFEAELLEKNPDGRPSTYADFHAFSAASGGVAVLVVRRTGSSRPPPPVLISALPAGEIRRYLYLLEDWLPEGRRLFVVRMIGSTKLTVRMRDLNVAEMLQRARGASV